MALDLAACAGHGGQYHGGPVEQVLPAGGKAGVLPARHGVAAHVGEGGVLKGLEKGPAHRPLHAAQVHRQGSGSDVILVRDEVVYRRGGVEGGQDHGAFL